MSNTIDHWLSAFEIMSENAQHMSQLPQADQDVLHAAQTLFKTLLWVAQ